MIAANEKLLAVFERMATRLGVICDRSELRKLFAAAEAGGGDPLGSLYRVAERYRIRLGVFDGSFDEALQFARQGYPVAIAPPAGASAEANTPADDWWVLLEIRRRGIKTWTTEVGGKTTRKSLRSLRRLLQGNTSADSTRRLIIAQHLDAGASDESNKTPLARLLALLKPDRGDVLAIAVFAIVVGILGLATPLAVEALVNTVAFNRYLQPIVILAIILFTFLAFAGALTVVMAIITEIIQRRLFVRVGLDLGHRLSNLDQRVLDSEHGPELVNRFLDIVTLQKSVAKILLDGIGLAIAVVIGMVVLAAYHPFLLGFDIVLLALMAFLIFALGGGAVKTSIKESKEKYYMVAWLQNIVANPTAFRLHGGGLFAMDRTDQLAAHYLELRKSHFLILLRQIVFAVTTQVVASVVLLTIGGWLVIQNQLTLGQLVAAELIVAVIVGAFAKMGKHLETYYDVLAAVDKLGVLLDLPEAELGGHDLLPTEGPLRLDLREVSVNASEATAISGFSARLAAGGSAVVLGVPGAGKTVLLEALATMRPVAGGSVEINGIDLRQIDHAEYARRIGYVRGIEVFAGTIAENVDLHRGEILAADVKQALEMVGLDDEVRKLEHGVNTELIPGGRPLTSTQAARLMIARAIAGKPSILMIDSLLDSLPQSAAEEIISRLHARPMPWTLIVATSRADFADLFLEKWRLPG